MSFEYLDGRDVAAIMSMVFDNFIGELDDVL
jgi:hypothetical protein